MEEDRVSLSEERRFSKVRLLKKNIPDGGIDHLLILAHSAELMLESEDNFHSPLRNDQNHKGCHTTPIARQLQDRHNNATARDQKPLGKQLDGMQVIAHVKTEEDGFHSRGRITRLSQFRRLARSKNHILGQERIAECRHEYLDCQTSESKLVGKCIVGRFPARTTRLSQFRRQARSKNNLFVQEKIKEFTHGHLDCQTFKDNQTERVAAKQYIKEESRLVERMHDHQIHKELDQCAAVNVEAENKITHVKGRMRLSQLRREARLGNAHLFAQRHAGTLDRGEVDSLIP